MKRRNTVAVVVLGCILTVFTVSADLFASVYYVSKQGSDENDGRTREAAFATIQRGVGALEPGDTLTIGPGEYAENVTRDGLGSGEADTVIQGEIPGTAILRGDVPAPPFEKVEGFRFVYAGRFERNPLAVIEHDTLRVLTSKPELGEIEYSPGSFHYDAGEETLYISPSDLRSPEGRRYTVTVKGGSGLFLSNATRVIVDGLAATGYCAPTTGWHYIRSWSWGIAFAEPDRCVVRRAKTYLNHGGVGLHNGPDNLVDDCLSFGNMHFNILVFGGPDNRGNVIQNSYAYRSRNGMHFYARAHGPMTLRDNVAWGHDIEFSNKTGGGSSAEFGLVERCVGLGFFQANGLRNTIMGGGNEYDRQLQASEDNILFLREEALDLNAEFADPRNLDFRLQADSRFRGRDGAPHRGIAPYEENIFYASPHGDDDNDGLDLSRPWRTLSGALERLRPGDTLYLTEGVYEADTVAQLGRPGADIVSIRGRGEDTVVVRGPLRLRDSADVKFQRLAFEGALTLEGGEGFEVENCRFAGDNGGLRAERASGLRVRHCLFAGTALEIAQGADVFSKGNFFANPDRAAILVSGDDPFAYADYNGFQDPSLAYSREGAAMTLREAQAAGMEIHSMERATGVTMEGGLPQPSDAVALAGWGPGSRSLGPHDDRAEPPLRVAGPFVHRATDTTADIEWWSSEPVGFELAWGETAEMGDTVEIPKSTQYAGYTLRGLKPGQEYHVRLRPLADEENSGPSERVAFETTAAPPEPKVYYVAPDGDDDADGLARDRAFRTVAKAAASAGPGDTVVVAAGDYPETVWVRGSGTAERPVSYRAAPGERVAVRTFRLTGKQHVKLDGFYTSERINAFLSNDIEVTRCFSRGTLVHAQNSSDILIQNCVAVRGYFAGVSISNSGGVRIENSVMHNPAIYGVLVVNQGPDKKVAMRRNIFTDSIPFKARVQYFEISSAEALEKEDNCYYMRAPDPEMDLEERNMFLFYAREDSAFKEYTRVCLTDYKRHFGETGSLMANPRFRGAEGIELEEGARFTPEDNLRNPNNTGFLILTSDRMGGNLDFPDLFATHPDLVAKGVGLIPEAFEDFHFNVED